MFRLLLGLGFKNNSFFDHNPEIIELSEGGFGYTSLLSVGSGRFSCSGHPFFFDNLKEFSTCITQAYDVVEGKARLGHTWEKDFLEIEVLSDGHVVITGFIAEYGPLHHELSFAFGCDQTYLQQLLRSLSQVGKDLE